MRNIGEGSQAVVNLFEKRNGKQNRLFAVKTFKKNISNSSTEGDRDLLEAEIDALRELTNSPGITELKAVYQDDLQIYLVFPFCEGGPLDLFIHNKPFKHAIEVRSVMMQLLLAVELIHSKGYIHRDLKPENILFKNTRSLEVTIIDFGFVCN